MWITSQHNFNLNLSMSTTVWIEWSFKRDNVSSIMANFYFVQEINLYERVIWVNVEYMNLSKVQHGSTTEFQTKVLLLEKLSL